ncbi:MAG: D-glucuronyl C5-epimerase family protein, partial [Gaiellaceae bacterium]
MRGSIPIAAAAAALCLAGAPPALAAKPLPAQKQALEAVRKAVAAGKIDGPTAAAARVEIARAARLIRRLPSGRREHVEVALTELGAFSGRLIQPRAVSLIGELKINDDYFSKHWAPAPKTDVTDADGVVYRYFAGRCLEFHPLASFGALNALVARGDVDGTRRLADALVARGVYQHGGGTAWEYTFPYGGGVPWVSGMAQAVAAQSLARAAGLVEDQTTVLMREAHAAFGAIPGRLLTQVAAGPWIRLYSFERVQVLNAQLQAIVSLTTYAGDAEDAQAAALAARMARAAAATLPSFDTGYWTYYALPNDPSPLDYQQFVVQLLRKLGPGDPRFADAASRIAAYEKQPPAFMLANAGLGEVRFWLSKPSSVQVTSGAGPTKRLALEGGWHTLSWSLPKRAGIYPVHVDAVDWAGNRASFDALPIVRATSTLMPNPPAKKPKRATSNAKEGQPSFAVGAGLEDPSQLALAQKADLGMVRLGVAWPAGATTPDPGAVAVLQGLTASTGVVVDLNVTALPTDQPSLAALAAYAASLAQQVPTLRDLLLAPAPVVATATTYAATFAAVRDAVHAVEPQMPVGVAIDGAQAPKQTVAALARSLQTGGPDLVAFRPASAAAKGSWTVANTPQLASALAHG